MVHRNGMMPFGTAVPFRGQTTKFRGVNTTGDHTIPVLLVVNITKNTVSHNSKIYTYLVGLSVYGRSYSIWSPVIVRLRHGTAVVLMISSYWIRHRHDVHILAELYTAVYLVYTCRVNKAKRRMKKESSRYSRDEVLRRQSYRCFCPQNKCDYFNAWAWFL